MDVFENTENRACGVIAQTTNKRIGPSPIGEQETVVVNDLLTGVSVRYTPKEGCRWYVLRATYGREIQALKAIRAKGGTAYVALYHTRDEVGGKLHKVVRPFVRQFVFLYATKTDADRFVNQEPGLSFLNYYYDHFKTISTGYNPPLTVPYAQMMSFIRITSVDDDHVELVSKEQVRIKSGDTVRITDGKFKGITGKVARIGRQNRVVVEIEGVCMIATAFIPRYALETVATASDIL